MRDIQPGSVAERIEMLRRTARWTDQFGAELIEAAIQEVDKGTAEANRGDRDREIVGALVDER